MTSLILLIVSLAILFSGVHFLGLNKNKMDEKTKASLGKMEIDDSAACGT